MYSENAIVKNTIVKNAIVKNALCNNLNLGIIFFRLVRGFGRYLHPQRLPCLKNIGFNKKKLSFYFAHIRGQLYLIQGQYTWWKYTVGENIIATTKMRNNYGAIQSFIFLYCPCNVITLNPLCILFCISSLLLFWLLSL